MKVLVTGGAGFIGSYIVDALVKRNDEVIVIDNLSRGNKLDKDIINSITFIRGDVRDMHIIEENAEGCDIIYHFAAVLGVDIVAENPVETMETEVIGMKNIVDAAIRFKIPKIIYASTSGVYGHSAIEKSTSENIQLDPRTSYAISKRYNEIYLASLYEEKRLEPTSLRFFNVYGPKQDTRMVIPIFFKQAFSGDPITVYGSGFQTRDFTYIDDSVTACLKVADEVSGCEQFNVANENEITIMELADIIKSITGSKSEIITLKTPNKRYDFEVERRVGNSEKLFNATNFKPKTSIEEGILKIYKSYQIENKL